MSDWHQTALTKLTRVMGERVGRTLMAEVLHEVGLVELKSASDLKRFADALATRSGFASPLGSLLRLHATLNDR